MKKSIVLYLLIITSGLLNAQSIYQELEPVSIQDLEMTSYKKDKDAEAVVLYDFGESYFNPTGTGFDLILDRTIRVKIFEEAGLDFADIEISTYVFDAEIDEIEFVSATTYNLEEGKIVETKLKKDQVFQEEGFGSISMKFAMPNVKPGSIIEYKYFKKSRNIEDFNDWEFQWTIPVTHSEYQVKLIPYYHYKWVMQSMSGKSFYAKKTKTAEGLEKSIFGRKYREQIHTFVMKDLPAFKDVDYISSKSDFTMKMDWQLIKYFDIDGHSKEFLNSWEKILSSVIKNNSLGKYAAKTSKKVSKLLDTKKTLSMATDRERANYAIAIIKDNFEWNGWNTPAAGFEYKELREEGSGSSGTINLTTIALLNAIGVEAYPLLISTLDHGKILYDYPFYHYFNYVLIYAKINGEFIMLDATNKYLDNFSIPTKCINGKGFLVKKGDVTWIPIKSETTSSAAYSYTSSFTEEETISKIKQKFTGYRAAAKRKFVDDDDFDINTGLIELDGVDEESVEMFNLKETDSAFIMQYDLYEESPLGEDKIFHNPFLSEVIDKNPFKQKKRKYPVYLDFVKKVTYIAQIEIPEGYEIDYYKNDFENIINDYVEIRYITNVTDDKVNIILSYSFKKRVYPATSYGRLKYYYDQIIKLGQEKVVFKKVD